MALCPLKVELDNGEILVCRRSERDDETHRDGLIEFVRVDVTTFAIQRYEIVIEEVFG